MKGRIYQKQNGTLVDITPDALPIVAARNIGETVFSLAPLSDAGLHLLDGSVLSAGGMYAEAVAHFAALQADYPNLFVTEAAWQTSVSTYGVCGKFVYDATAGTLRIPKVTGHIAGTIDPTAIGDLIEAGLPGINASIVTNAYYSPYWNGTATGAFNNPDDGSSASRTYGGGYSGATNCNRLDFDASRSSSIYGNSDTVQPQAIKGFFYLVIANRTKTPIVADIDEIAADLQLKADVDLGNVTSPGNVRMAHAAMPSGQYIDLTLPASGGTVTMPADGWLIWFVDIIGGNATLWNNYSINPQRVTSGMRFDNYQNFHVNQSLTIPVSKGDIVTVYWVGTMSTDSFCLVYANGSAS